MSSKMLISHVFSMDSIAPNGHKKKTRKEKERKKRNRRNTRLTEAEISNLIRYKNLAITCAAGIMT
jgi:hypothetical protein